MQIDVIDGMVRTTRNTAWRWLGAPIAGPLRSGLTVLLGRRRLGRLLLGHELDGLRREILRACVTSAGAPPVASLATRLERPEEEIRRAMAHLAAQGLIELSETGEIAAAAPFSFAPAPYRVVLPGTREAFAASAVAALGIPLLVGGVGEIHSACPQSGQKIAVKVQLRRILERSPAEAVVGLPGDPSDGGLEGLCRRAQFFASESAARVWLAKTPPARGRVVSIGSALLVAKRLFDDRVALAA